MTAADKHRRTAIGIVCILGRLEYSLHRTVAGHTVYGRIIAREQQYSIVIICNTVIELRERDLSYEVQLVVEYYDFWRTTQNVYATCGRINIAIGYLRIFARPAPCPGVSVQRTASGIVHDDFGAIAVVEDIPPAVE